MFGAHQSIEVLKSCESFQSPQGSMTSFVSSFSGTQRNFYRATAPKARFRMQTPTSESKITLYSAPVSNYSARCRYLIRRKNLSEDQIAIRSLSTVGGTKTEQYLRVNPLGKIPAIVLESEGRKECIFESSVICEYLVEIFSNQTPSFLPHSPEARAKARLIANILDIYVGPYHQFMYKKIDGDRESEVNKMLKGFDTLEHILSPQGPYLTGEELSVGDCCLWGSMPFYDYMLPTFFGWHPTDQRPKLAAWREHMFQESQAARDVYSEVFENLQAWWDNGRWDDLSMKPLSSRPKLPF